MHRRGPRSFLDHDLYDHGVRCLEEKTHRNWNDGDQTLIRDTEVSKPGKFIRDRIGGIDDIATARAWQAVERALDRTP